MCLRGRQIRLIPDVNTHRDNRHKEVRMATVDRICHTYGIMKVRDEISTAIQHFRGHLTQRTEFRLPPTSEIKKQRLPDWKLLMSLRRGC